MHTEFESITWAYSPCPNDTYIFGALANGLLPDWPMISQPMLADIAELNQLAEEANFDVIKISAAAYPLVYQLYQILDCGGALGNGVGPLVVARMHAAARIDDTKSIAIPGWFTTAHALFKHFFPMVVRKEEMKFSSVEQSVLEGKTDLGLLIHEGRFVYQSHGLRALADLGELWEKQFQLPIPLGIILPAQFANSA